MARGRTRYSLAVELTSLCNLRCRHCYNAFDHTGSNSLPTDQLLGLLRRALDEVPLKRVTLTGGEPFASEALFGALELCAAHGVPADIISNGTLVTAELASRARSFPSLSVVQITLNGPTAEVHDAEVGVRGAWDRALQGIEHLQRRGVRVVGCMVVTRRSTPFVAETLERMRALGITFVALSRLMSAGQSAHNLDLIPTRSDLVEVLRQASSPRFRRMYVRISGPLPSCMVEHRSFPSIRFGWCPIGTTEQDFALGSDGHLRHCLLYGSSLGDARQHSFLKLMQGPVVTSYRRRAPEFCRGCVELPRCLGGCGAAALAVFGTETALDPLVLQHVDPAFAHRVRCAREQRAALPVSPR